MLKKKAKKKARTVISIDNYAQHHYALRNQTLVPENKLTFKSNSFHITYLANKNMIIAPIELGLGIHNEDLDGALENRAYEELGLDPTVEYLINYEEIDYSGDSRMFQLFIIEKDQYVELFSDLQKKVKYIDYITPAPLLYQTLYDLELVESKGVHCYLYFTQHDTFVTFYKNGKYLYSKSIQYSFEQIYHRYCEMAGETVDENMFFKVLQKEGMRATQTDYQQNIMKLFGEIFISINDIVIYTKRAYELEVVDQMFIGSSLGPIVGLDDYAQNYLGLYSSSLEFDFDLKTDEWHIDQLQYMMVVKALQYTSQKDTVTNFTLYPRPPVFLKRPSGQAFVAVLLAASVGLAYPAYYYIVAKATETRNDILSSQELKLNSEVTKYKTIISQKRKMISGIDKNIKSLKESFFSKEKTLTSVYNKKVYYRLKSEQFRLFADDLVKYHVKTYNIETKGDTYYISLVAVDDRDITELIKHISKTYGNDISRIDIEMIKKDPDSSFYQGVLKVVMR